MDIILCATQRCGSTLIVEDMRNTGVLGQPQEWFIPWGKPKADKDWKLALDAVHRKARGENGVTAVKIMANQLFPVNARLSSFVPAAQKGDFAHVAAAFQGALWVYLRRKDIVAQAISRHMAQQTGINHATAKPDQALFAGSLARGYSPDYNQDAKYSYGAILTYITAITIENLAWQRFFSTHGIAPLELVYEDVIADAQMTHLNRIAQGVGQSIPPHRQPRKMVQLANEKNAAWLERFYNDAARYRFRPRKHLAGPVLPA